MKRYSLHYTVNEKDETIHPQYVLGQYDRLWGNANSVKSLKGDVSKIIQKDQDAHDFRIYDHSRDDYEPTAYEHCISVRKDINNKWEDRT